MNHKDLLNLGRNESIDQKISITTFLRHHQKRLNHQHNVAFREILSFSFRCEMLIREIKSIKGHHEAIDAIPKTPIEGFMNEISTKSRNEAELK